MISNFGKYLTDYCNIYQLFDKSDVTFGLCDLFHSAQMSKPIKLGNTAAKGMSVAAKGVSMNDILPDDVLIEIFLHVPGPDLAKSCARVCRLWRDLLGSQTVWVKKCLQYQNYPPEILQYLADENYKVLYFKRPYLHNLIINPDASQGFKNWKITKNGGDHWGCEVAPIGSDPVSQFHQCTSAPGCWVTSYGWCEKIQVIDLLAAGCSTNMLDNIRPTINVSEWFAARFDCGIQYEITVLLLGNIGGMTLADIDSPEDIPKDTILERWHFEATKPAGREWFSTGQELKDYPAGVRYIFYSHRGRDTQFWAGRFGAKITMSNVTLDFSHMAGSETK